MTPKCPNCQAVLGPSDGLCPTCRIDLRTPEVAELFQLDAYFAGGLARRQQLLESLFVRRDAAAQTPPMPPPGWVQAPAPVQSWTVPAPRPELQPEETSSNPIPEWLAYPERQGLLDPALPKLNVHISAQHVLLTIGALLVLSASAVFIAAIWHTIGLTGQALVMSALTLAAGAATVASARRSLAATAEAFAATTLGLTIVDLFAVRHYDLAGAASATPSWYFGLSLAVVGSVAFVLEMTSPGIRLALPVASFAFAWCPWAPLLQYADSDSTHIAYLALAIAAFDIVLSAAFVTLRGGAPTRLPRGIATAIAGSVTALACTVQIVASLTTFLSLDSTLSRYGVWIALWALPLAVLVAGRFVSIPRFASATAAVWIGAVALLPIIDLPVVGYVVLAASVLTANIWMMKSRRDQTIVHGVAAAINVILAAAATALTADSADSLRHAFNGLQSPVASPLATAAIGIAILPILAGIYLRFAKPDAVAWVVGLAAPFGLLVFNLADVHGLAGTATGGTVAGITYLAIAAILLRQPSVESGELELVAVSFSGGFLLLALLAAANAGLNWTAAVAYATGIAIVAYATSPGRMRAAYLGSAMISAGTAALTHAHDVRVIEVVTVPAAAMLAAIGWLEWRRNPEAPTFLTVGPWLSVLLLPTSWQGLSDGQTWRAAVAIVIGSVAVILGFARNGRAPVIIGAIVLLVMAITRGGPYLSYVPSWVLLYGGGAALLACGVMWERAIALGRKSARYLIEMR